MKATRDPADYLEYRRRKEVAQRITKDAKKNSWRSYCGSLNDRTKMGEVWKTSKKMSGVNTQYSMFVSVRQIFKFALLDLGVDLLLF